MSITKSRNYCMDFVKGIACICVVFMHCEFPGKLGIIIQCISRFSVPFFFMVSGYFCYSKSSVNYKKKISHIIKIICGAVVLYFGIALLFDRGGYTVSWKSIRDLLIFNVPFIIAGQMWFLFALLYDYVLFSIIDHYKLHRITKVIIPLGIVLYVILAQGMHLLGIHIPNKIYRNFLIEGLPLFSLGYWLHRNEQNINISNRFLYVMLIITTALCVFERKLLGRDFGVNISTFAQVLVLFIYCINNSDRHERSRITLLGSKYSLYVYVIHPAVWHFLDQVYQRVNIDTNLIALYLRPLLCAGISIMISIVYIQVLNLYKKRKSV